MRATQVHTPTRLVVVVVVVAKKQLQLDDNDDGARAVNEHCVVSVSITRAQTREIDSFAGCAEIGSAR